MFDDSPILIKAFQIILLVTAPALVTAMVVGIVVGLLQSAIQVQDQTVGYVIKLAAVACVLLVASSWMMQQLTGLFDLILETVPVVGKRPR